MNTYLNNCRYILLKVLFVFLLMIILIDTADAIPAFARKYQANCALCHSSEPRLTPFGQKFLENGYQFPGTTDGNETAKITLEGQQGPVTLDEISNIMAVRIRADILKPSFREITDDMQSEGVDDSVSLEFPTIINLFFGGTATKNISYFLESEYNTMEAHGGSTAVIFERAFLQFSNLGGAQSIANLKIGRFDPSFLYSFPTHRQQLNPILAIADTNTYPPQVLRIPLLPLAFSTKMYGLSTATSPAGSLVDDGFQEGFAILPFQPYLYNAPFQNSVAIFGRPWGDGSPLLYQLGIALNDKAGGEEQRTDVYGMLRYDFQVSDVTAQVSGFYYYAPDASMATLINIMPLPDDPSDNTIVYANNATDMIRYGIGARAQWSNFDVYGTYIADSIDQPEWAAAPLQTSVWDTDASGVSLEFDWRFHANWMFGLRYDWMKTAGLSRLPTVATATGSVNDPLNPKVQFISPIIKYYPSPNIGLYARAHVNLTADTTLPDTAGRITGFDGQQNPASNLKSMYTVGVDMAF